MKFVLFIVCFTWIEILFAQDGTLDQTFDKDGIVTTSIRSGNDFANVVLIQADGKILVGGNSGVYLVLARYLKNGLLDNTFGTGGIVTTLVAPGNAVCNSIALQQDGKIVLAGYHGIFPNFDIVVARYRMDGILDNTFDMDGIVTTSIGAGIDQGRSVAIQKDGKIVVIGNYDNGSNSDIVVTRFNTNGSLDPAFDSDGIVTTAVGNAGEIGRSIAIQTDGKIMIAGYSYTQASFGYEFLVLRYNIDGSLDHTFNLDGIVTTDFVSQNDYGESILLQSDGKIMVGGYSFTGFLCLARYHNNGSLDSSFATNGKVTTFFGCAYQNDYSIAIQKDGKYLISGFSNLSSPNVDFSLARYTSSGILDSMFDFDGIVKTPIGVENDIACCRQAGRTADWKDCV